MLSRASHKRAKSQDSGLLRTSSVFTKLKRKMTLNSRELDTRAASAAGDAATRTGDISTRALLSARSPMPSPANPDAPLASSPVTQNTSTHRLQHSSSRTSLADDLRNMRMNSVRHQAGRSVSSSGQAAGTMYPTSSSGPTPLTLGHAILRIRQLEDFLATAEATRASAEAARAKAEADKDKMQAELTKELEEVIFEKNQLGTQVAEYAVQNLNTEAEAAQLYQDLDRARQNSKLYEGQVNSLQSKCEELETTNLQLRVQIPRASPSTPSPRHFGGSFRTSSNPADLATISQLKTENNEVVNRLQATIKMLENANNSLTREWMEKNTVLQIRMNDLQESSKQMRDGFVKVQSQLQTQVVALQSSNGKLEKDLQVATDQSQVAIGQCQEAKIKYQELRQRVTSMPSLMHSKPAILKSISAEAALFKPLVEIGVAVRKVFLHRAFQRVQQLKGLEYEVDPELIKDATAAIYSAQVKADAGLAKCGFIGEDMNQFKLMFQAIYGRKLNDAFDDILGTSSPRKSPRDLNEYANTSIGDLNFERFDWQVTWNQFADQFAELIEQTKTVREVTTLEATDKELKVLIDNMEALLNIPQDAAQFLA